MVHIPRQMTLQRTAAVLQLKIGSIFTREEAGGHIAVINMTVPSLTPLASPTQLPFEVELMPSPYTAVESAAESTL